MKRGYLLILFLLCPTLALADIYKSVDADGHITYSSAPLKSGKRIIETPASTPAAHARSSATPEGFPKVNQDTQNSRDETRRRILQDELKIEQTLLFEAKRDLQAAETSPNTTQNSVKLKELSGEVEMHQRNIDALDTEISKLK